MNTKVKALLRWADDTLILGQRLAEWCGHGPVLEQDIALTNISLDLIGQARSYYQYAANLEGGEKTEDTYAYHRDVPEFNNHLMVETPNGHWGNTILRQFFFDTYHFYLLEKLRKSNDEQIAAIAEKSIKEVSYHAQYTAEWVIRLGDGTEESKAKMEEALENLWAWTPELFESDENDKTSVEEGWGVDPASLKEDWMKKVSQVFEMATLKVPESTWGQTGGRNGEHSENLGYILAEMQYLPKSYPDAKW